jgi:hypothetical protein
VRTNRSSPPQFIAVRNECLAICSTPEEDHYLLSFSVQHFHLGKQKSPLLLGKKALSDLWEIVLLVIYERVSTMKLEAI